MTTQENRPFFSVLDSFRGICACIVAFSHFNANSIFYGSPLLDRGSIYVDFFFVLSGFVIFANYAQRLQDGFGIGKFVFLRFGRLYPLHFAVFMGYILIELLQLFIHVEGAALNAPFTTPGEDWKAILANLFLFHSMGIIDTLAFNGPSWSISVEFYTYIAFAFLLVYTGRYYKQATLAVALISAAIVFFNHEDLYAKLDFGFFRCIFGFAFGGLTWEIYKTFGSKIGAKLDGILKINALEIVTLTAAVLYINYLAFDALSFFAPLVFSFVILVFSFEKGLISSFLKKKFFLFLGMLSYSIYMTHLFISGKFFALPIRLLENRMGWDISFEANGVTMYCDSIWMGTLLELFYLCVVIACSFISYKLIEEPARNLSKYLLKKQQAKKSVECHAT